MDDVIISSEQRPEPQPQPKPQQVKAPAKKQNVQKPKKKRKFFVYLLDLLQKTLIASLLIGINFMLFCGAGSMGVFGTQALPVDEVWMILAGIAAICFAFIFLLSFSEFLQNLFLAAVAAAVFLASVNQFALFDKGAVLYDWAKLYAGNDSSYFAEYSHYILAALVALVMFVFGKTARKSTVTYFIGILLLIFAGIGFDSYIERHKNHDFRVVYENPADEPRGKGKKFVYIAMPNLASYSYLQSVAKDNPKARKALAAMLGFYNNNDFTMYTNAMVADKNAVNNLISTLNAGSHKKTEDFVLKTPWHFGNWDFSRVNSDKLYLRDNRIFDVLSRSGYEINAYQTQGLELCLKNNGPAVNHCVEKNNFPLNLGDGSLSTADKVLILAGEWLESTGLAKGSSMLYSVLDTFLNVNNVPFIGTSYDKLYVVDSFDVLKRVAVDMTKAKGDAAYFVKMDLPADMYVYDEFCRMKPLNQWVRKDDLEFGQAAPLTKKRDAYFDQLACTYGSLQAFMDELQKNGQAKKTVLIIQGLNGLDDNVTTVAAENLQNKQSVSMAIRDPLRHGFGVKKEICMAPEILQKYLFKKGDCRPEKTLGVHAEVYKNLVKALEEHKITKEDINAASEKFVAWYKDWKAAKKATGVSGKEKSAVLPKAGTVPAPAQVKAEKEGVSEKAKIQPKTEKVAEKPAENNVKKEPEAIVPAEKKSVPTEQKTEQSKPEAASVQPEENKVEPSKDVDENSVKEDKPTEVSDDSEKTSDAENSSSGDVAATDKEINKASSEENTEEKQPIEEAVEKTETEETELLSSEQVSEFDELGDELGLPSDDQPEVQEMKTVPHEEVNIPAQDGKSVGTLMKIDEKTENSTVPEQKVEDKKSVTEEVSGSTPPEDVKVSETADEKKKTDVAGKAQK